MCSPSLVRLQNPQPVWPVLQSTVFHTNVGHVCSMAHFDLDPYGNPCYAPAAARGLQADPEARSRREKVERSLVSFAACYPSWRPPDRSVARFIEQLDPAFNHPSKTGARSRGPPINGGVTASPGACLAASVAVPGAAIGGAWALMPQTDAIPASGLHSCLLYTSPSPRDRQKSRMPSSA